MLNCHCTPCCENLLRVSSVSTSGGSTFLVTDSTITPKNGCKYILKIPCAVLPTTAITTVNPVYVVVNGRNIPLQELIGNQVYTDQLKCLCPDKCGNIVLRLVYGSTPTHFKIVSHKLCCSTAYGQVAAVASVSAITENE